MDVFFSNQDLIETTLRQLHRGQLLYRHFTPNIPVRWDALSYAVYGSPWLQEILHRANPQLTGFVTIPAGATVTIPEVEQRPWVDPNSLPPWDPRRELWRS